MAGYLVAEIDVKDPEAYRKYTDRTPAVIAAAGGRYIVRGGKTETLEGPEFTRRLVILEFPTADAARAFYASPEYQEIRPLRTAVAEGRVMIVDGFA